MKKSVNFTGRKKLNFRGKRRHFALVRESGEGKPFEFKLLLTNQFYKLKFADGSRVILDASYRALNESFVVGEVDQEKDTFRGKVRRIDPDVARFVVKVVEPGGKLLARSAVFKAESVDVEEGVESGAEGFLSVRSVAMEQFWKIEMVEGSRPTLLVNKDLQVKNRLNNDVILRAAIFPSALREIVRAYAMRGDFEDGGDQWSDVVLDFCKSLYDEPLPDEVSDESVGTEFSEWLDGVVDNYIIKIRLFNGIHEFEEMKSQ